ncbi:MAG TPA: hypothetical protein DCZ01_09840 [Elusimicrobia bacterium]|nr:hypothetical protein [Elusimicrobiota bacterium]
MAIRCSADSSRCSYFEDVPAADRRADHLYLEEVDRCAIYIGLFGDEYGHEDAEGFSPTEREFDRVSAKGKIRLIFVKGADDTKKNPKMQALVRKAGDQLIRWRFTGVPDLTANLYASLIEHLEQTAKLRTGPFDAAAYAAATTQDLSEDKVRQFLRIAHQEHYDVTKPTAFRDLDDLKRKGILKKVGTTGKGTYYTLCRIARNRRQNMISTRSSRPGRTAGLERQVENFDQSLHQRVRPFPSPGDQIDGLINV